MPTDRISSLTTEVAMSRETFNLVVVVPIILYLIPTLVLFMWACLRFTNLKTFRFQLLAVLLAAIIGVLWPLFVLVSTWQCRQPGRHGIRSYYLGD